MKLCSAAAIAFASLASTSADSGPFLRANDGASVITAGDLVKLSDIAVTSDINGSVNGLDCGSESVKQADYRGTIGVTESGRTCQRWDVQAPHAHSRTPDQYPDKGLENNNYCRNPDGEPRAWCYTTDKNKRWEVCKVPFCSDSLTIVSVKCIKASSGGDDDVFITVGEGKEQIWPSSGEHDMHDGDFAKVDKKISVTHGFPRICVWDWDSWSDDVLGCSETNSLPAGEQSVRVSNPDEDSVYEFQIVKRIADTTL